MTSHVAWNDIRAEHVAHASGEVAVEAGKRELLAEVIGHRLAEIRRTRGLTQQQVADRMGVSKYAAPTVRDGALLVARLLLGVMLIAHGWQKVVTNGLGATAEGFGQMGVPLAPVSATYAGVVELVGGALILVGAATALVGVLIVLDMLGAALLVHVSNGVMVTDGGWELVGVIGALALVLAAVGAGRYSVDHALTARRTAAAV